MKDKTKTVFTFFVTPQDRIFSPTFPLKKRKKLFFLLLPVMILLIFLTGSFLSGSFLTGSFFLPKLLIKNAPYPAGQADFSLLLTKPNFRPKKALPVPPPFPAQILPLQLNLQPKQRVLPLPPQGRPVVISQSILRKSLPLLQRKIFSKIPASQERTLSEAVPDKAFQNPPVTYPPAAVNDGEQGTVSVLLHISATGSVSKISLLHSSGLPILNQQVLTTLILWHFLPVIKQGHPIASVQKFQIDFELSS